MTEKRYLELWNKIQDGGTVSFKSEKEWMEFEHARIRHNQKKIFPKLAEYAKEGNWQDFCDLVYMPELIPIAFIFYDRMPVEYRRDFVINCYESHGDHVAACREALKKLPKKGLNELPKRYRDKEFITVYRAGEEDLIKAPYRLSWTLDRKIAEFFLNDNIGRHANYLYQAKIKPCDVIAYTNNRKEQEVLQYRKVFDVQLLQTVQS